MVDGEYSLSKADGPRWNALREARKSGDYVAFVGAVDSLGVSYESLNGSDRELYDHGLAQIEIWGVVPQRVPNEGGLARQVVPVQVENPAEQEAAQAIYNGTVGAGDHLEDYPDVVRRCLKKSGLSVPKNRAEQIRAARRLLTKYEFPIHREEW